MAKFQKIIFLRFIVASYHNPNIKLNLRRKKIYSNEITFQNFPFAFDYMVLEPITTYHLY